jgi:hypothetical protein
LGGNRITRLPSPSEIGFHTNPPLLAPPEEELDVEAEVLEGEDEEELEDSAGVPVVCSNVSFTSSDPSISHPKNPPTIPAVSNVANATVEIRTMC